MTWHSKLWEPDTAAPDDTLDDIAFTLADSMEDWVSECLAWGEQRIATYVIPSRLQPS